MITRKVASIALAASMTVGLSPAFAQQAAGSIGGKATDEAKAPYNRYTVQLRDAASGQVAATVPLNQQGQFSFANVEMARRYLIELVQGNRVLCTEGPYTLSAANPTRNNVVIECGSKQTAQWLLAAGAGAAAAIALATRSASQ